ncbi:hypothetical protein EW146_g2695 [Bondarzewia mesenterica]|uniref:DNA 3'-5' helicase n=1 Tax=Bondarzewia mesenterica TaxID=1095465 RepID=A0A4S4M1P9_9AGAM|nr:hypothetical protein EW146_g2695 [Bondarzewia mesenterica]
MPDPPSTPIPLLSQIRDKTSQIFGRRPCTWQLKAVEAVLKRDRDVVCIAGTGSGKTLTFWMPLLFRRDGIQIVVAPLNILGKQNVEQLAALGDIAEGKYQVIVVNPEIIMKDGGGFEKLWKNDAFVSRIISIVWDEAHCISTWGDFRPEYKEAGRLRHLIPLEIPFYVVSATLPPQILSNVMDTLQINRSKATIIQHSNDRPNVHITIRKIQYSLNSYRDLAFLIKDHWKSDDERPPKFLIFFDNISDSFREKEVAAFRDGRTWGLCCTDSFGMGIDLPDIALVIQWRAKCGICTLWQRFGRGAHDPNLKATAVLFAEAKYFDNEKEKAALVKAKRDEKGKRRAQDQDAERVIPSIADHALAENRNATIGSSCDVPAPTRIADAVAKCQAWREVYGQSASTLAQWKAKGKFKKKLMNDESLEPAMDDMLNAGTREWNCYRAPSMVYFENDKLESDHQNCRSDVPTGCARCSPPSIDKQLCCSLCSPASFTHLHFLESPTTRTCPPQYPPPPSARRLDMKYKATPIDMDLRGALHEFQKERMQAKYGAALLKNLGPAMIMSNDILQRIVDAAHTGHITSIGDLKHDLKWNQVEEYGQDIVCIVSAHAPPTPPISNPRAAAPRQLGPAQSNVPSRNMALSPALPSGAAQAKTRWPTSCSPIAEKNWLCPRFSLQTPARSLPVGDATDENCPPSHEERRARDPAVAGPLSHQTPFIGAGATAATNVFHFPRHAELHTVEGIAITPSMHPSTGIPPSRFYSASIPQR